MTQEERDRDRARWPDRRAMFQDAMKDSYLYRRPWYERFALWLRQWFRRAA